MDSHQLALGRLAAVEVDDVTHILAVALHNPVVAVEWQRIPTPCRQPCAPFIHDNDIPEQRLEARLGAEVFGAADKPLELRGLIPEIRSILAKLASIHKILKHKN